VRLEDDAVEPSIVDNVVGFVLLFLGIFAAGTLGILILENLLQPASAGGIDLVTAGSSVAATLGNIGPGLGRVGASQNYAWFSDASKILLSFFMILGRLEIYCVLLVFAPRVWRR
jgi:trk system potassium uptake protein TrkH